MREESLSENAARILATKQVEARQTYERAVSAHAVNECATDPSCGHTSARVILEQRYDALLREANGIRALLQALPGSMGHVAEEALWRIVIEQRR